MFNFKFISKTIPTFYTILFPTKLGTVCYFVFAVSRIGLGRQSFNHAASSYKCCSYTDIRLTLIVYCSIIKRAQFTILFDG